MDDDPAGCLVSVHSAGGAMTVLLSGTNRVSGQIDMSGLPPFVYFRARDSSGQEVWSGRRVIIDPLVTNLIKVADAPGTLLDFRPRAMLYYTNFDFAGPLAFPPPRTQSVVRLKDSVEDEQIESTPYLPFFGRIGEQGWVISTYVVPDAFRAMMEWKDGVEVSLGHVATLDIAGNWAAAGLAFQQTGFLRHLTTRTDVLTIERDFASFVSPRVADNGDFLYMTAEFGLYRSRLMDAQDPGGVRVTTLLTANAGDLFATDGTNVAFTRRGGLTEYVFRTPVSEEPLLSSTNARLRFELNNGWTAYTKLDDAGQRQIWVRSPGGTYGQRTGFSSSSFLESLSSDGQLTFTNSAGRYLSVHGGAQPLWVSSSLGRPVWLDGNLHLIIGRSVFRPAQGRLSLRRLVNATDWEVRLRGDAGLRHQLQVSSNLIDWSNLAVLTNSTGSFDHVDFEASWDVRFYRIFLLNE